MIMVILYCEVLAAIVIAALHDLGIRRGAKAGALRDDVAAGWLDYALSARGLILAIAATKMIAQSTNTAHKR